MSKSKTSKTQYRGVRVFPGKKGPTYEIDYIHPGTGHRVRKVLPNATSALDASELRAIEIGDAKRGMSEQLYNVKGREKPVLFETLLDEYLEWAETEKRSWRTDVHNAKPLRRAFEGKLASDITSFGVQGYKMSRLKLVSKLTINNELALGSQAFSKAISWGKHSGVNPFEGSRFKREKKLKPGSLSPEDVQSIIDEMPHSVKRDMVEFGFNCGWRISEIRGLKWADVDIDRGKARLTATKNNRPVEIVLNDAALDVIKRQVHRGEYVFCHLDGSPFRTNLPDAFKNAARRAGIYLPPRKAWHILRRTWASMFLQNGGDIATLQKLGNWEDISMPLWYADEGGDEYKREALNKLPKLGKKNGHGGKMEENAEASDVTS